jgi:secreted PhoX family phosphatase
MKENKTKRKTMMKGLFDDIKVTRRSFMKSASAATGSAVVLGTTFKPTLRALAEASETSAGGAGAWESATRDVPPGAPNRCMSSTEGR